MDEKTDGGEGGGGSGYQSDESKADAPASEPEGDTGSEPEGDYDDLGYPITKEGDADTSGKADDQSKQDSSADEKKSDDKKIEKKVTGYDADEKPAAEEKKEEKPAAEDDEATKLDFEVKAEGIPDEELKTIKSFAKSHKLTKEQTQAYLDMRAGEIKATEKAAEDAVAQAKINRQKQHDGWKKELREDPTFGGDKFAHHVHQAEKVLDEHFPNLKKALTDRGGMLPPYHMRDLAKLAEVLYGTESMVQGSAKAPESKNKDEDDALSFYT